MGVGAAFIMPSTLSILVNVFPPDERAKAIAIWADHHRRGRVDRPGHHRLAARALLVRLGVPREPARSSRVAFVGGWFLVPKSRDPERERELDPLGALLSIVGIVAARLRAHRGARQGLGRAGDARRVRDRASSCSRSSCCWELHTDEPMLDMRYFRNPAFSAGSGGMMLVFLAMYGVMFLMTQYFQLVLGYSPLDAAVRLLPMAPIMIIVAPLTPRLERPLRRQPRRWRVGMVLIALGLPAVPRPRPRTRRTGTCCSR